MSEIKNIQPRKNNFILGQEVAEDIFLRAWKSKVMHHAWILSGPKGIGKATLAYRIARFLLTHGNDVSNNVTSLNVSENSDIFQQISNGSHPDLLVIEKDYTETDKKKIIAAIRKGETLSDEELENFKKSAFIKVDEIRKIGEFLAKTSFNDGWRVVIIDSADDMNKNAANALLKILEEPPAKTVLLLISHNPGLLLPTIRSRCAKLSLATLNNLQVSSLLRRYRSELNEAMIAKLAELSEGSIGKALLYADVNAVEIYNDLTAIIYKGRNFALDNLLKFCDTISADEDKFAIMPELITRAIKDNFVSSKDGEALYNVWSEGRRMFADCSSVNMDKRFTLVNLLTKICKVI